jgi:methionyl-tRNA formyltransferase
MKIFNDIIVFCETKSSVKFNFETLHSFEIERDEFERKLWFNGENIFLENISQTIYFDSFNDPNSLDVLMKSEPDIIIVFGSGMLNKSFVNCFRDRIINLHGGDPELYRGLDSHLWALYHQDFESLITTIHHLDVELDTGGIILQSSLPIEKDMKLFMLRSINTEVCIKLSLSAIDMFKRFGKFISRPQRSRGRYYSAMPSDLKTVAEKKFNNFIKSIK